MTLISSTVNNWGFLTVLVSHDYKFMYMNEVCTVHTCDLQIFLSAASAQNDQGVCNFTEIAIDAYSQIHEITKMYIIV